MIFFGELYGPSKKISTNEKGVFVFTIKRRVKLQEEKWWSISMDYIMENDDIPNTDFINGVDFWRLILHMRHRISKDIRK